MKKPMKKTVKKADGGVIMSPVSNPKMSPGNTGPSGKMKPFERGGGERPSSMGRGARPMPMPSRPGPGSSPPVKRPGTPGGGDRVRANPIGGGPIGGGRIGLNPIENGPIKPPGIRTTGSGGAGRISMPMAKKKGGMAKGKKK